MTVESPVAERCGVHRIPDDKQRIATHLDTAAALNQTDAILAAAAASGQDIRDLRALLWASIDNDELIACAIFAIDYVNPRMQNRPAMHQTAGRIDSTQHQ